MSDLLIKEIKYKSRYYYLGLNYLIRNHSDNPHLISCYEGISFRDLARHIKFERTGKVFKLDNYLKRPRRFLLFTDSKIIKGVMVMISLPEFYNEIEYEDYVLIDAKTITGYKKLLNYLSFEGRIEIVTFNKEQAKLVKSKFPTRKIHHWSVFVSKKEIFNIFINAELMNENDLRMAKRLSVRVPEESSPFRLLKFQLKGLLYKNYVFLSSTKKPLTIVGISLYNTDVYQINYLIEILANNETALSVLESISRLIKKRGYRLVWRLRKKDIFRYKTLINKSGFIKLAEEYHLHLL